MVFETRFSVQIPEKMPAHLPGDTCLSGKNQAMQQDQPKSLGESRYVVPKIGEIPDAWNSALYTVPVLSPVMGEWGNWSPEKISAYGFHHRRMQPCKSRGLGTFH